MKGKGKKAKEVMAAAVGCWVAVADGKHRYLPID
jgi:hypothetical protein